MAVRTTVTLKDDLDGSPAEETVHFGLGPTEYEIDLSAANASRFRAQVAPFIAHARKAGGARRARAGRSAADRRASAEVRAWAKEHGVEISERGRIPTSVLEQYEKATTAR
jgi:Lsr2